MEYKKGKQIEPARNNELNRVSGGSKLWNWVQKAARWVKDHVVIGRKNIGIKGKF